MVTMWALLLVVMCKAKVKLILFTATFLNNAQRHFHSSEGNIPIESECAAKIDTRSSSS